MNRLTKAGSTKYDWDSNGNLIGVKDGQTTWNYTYDFDNRLIAVKVNGLV
jgi:YD repeat-containing protein